MRYEHDCYCNSCIFLGEYKEYDLYFCPQSGRPTIIARYGNNESDYMSGLDFCLTNGSPLSVGRHRAMAKGLLNERDRAYKEAELEYDVEILRRNLEHQDMRAFDEDEARRLQNNKEYYDLLFRYIDFLKGKKEVIK